MNHCDGHFHQDLDGIELCDLCAALVSAEDAFLGVVADSSATARGGLQHGERLLTACSREHLRALSHTYQNRPFDLEELWAAILLDAHARLGPLSTPQILRETGLSPYQLHRARDWHIRHRMSPRPELGRENEAG